MLKSLILSLVLVSAVVAKVERPLFFGRHQPTASDPLHYVHSDIITGLTYDVKLNENVVKLDDILSILAISCKTEELIITTEDTTIAALWKSNTVLHGGREWQCTNAAGSTAAFTRRFVSVSVLDEETIAVKTSSASVLDCFETASIRYNPRQNFSVPSSRNENSLTKRSTPTITISEPYPSPTIHAYNVGDTYTISWSLSQTFINSNPGYFEVYIYYKDLTNSLGSDWISWKNSGNLGYATSFSTIIDSNYVAKPNYVYYSIVYYYYGCCSSITANSAYFSVPVVTLSLASPGPFTPNEKISYTVDLTNQESLESQTIYVYVYVYASIPYLPDIQISYQKVHLASVTNEFSVDAPGSPSLFPYYLSLSYSCLADDSLCATVQSANFYVPISSSFQLAGLVDVSIDCDTQSGNTFSCTDSVTVDSLAPTTSSFNPPVPALSNVDVTMSASMLLNVSSSTSFEVSSFEFDFNLLDGVTYFQTGLSFSTQTSISIDATLDFYAQYAKNFSLYNSNDVAAVNDLVTGGITIAINPGLAIGIQLMATLEADLQISASHQTSSAATVTLTYNPSSNPKLSHTITPLSPSIESGSLSVLGTADVSIIVGVPVNFTLTFIEVFEFYGALIPSLEIDFDASYPAFPPSTAVTAGALLPALNFGVCQNNHYCEIQTFFGLDYAYGFNVEISLGGFTFGPYSEGSSAYSLFHSLLFGGCLFSPDATSGEESPVDFTLSLNSAFASQLQQAKSAASAVYAALVHDFNNLLASASSISSSSFQVQLTSLTGAVASFQIDVVAGSGLSVSKIAQALQTTNALNTFEASSFVDTSQQVTLTSSSNPSTTTSFYLTQQGGSSGTPTSTSTTTLPSPTNQGGSSGTGTASTTPSTAAQGGSSGTPTSSQVAQGGSSGTPAASSPSPTTQRGSSGTPTSFSTSPPAAQTHSAASSIGAGVNLLCLQAAVAALIWALM